MTARAERLRTSAKVSPIGSERMFGRETQREFISALRSKGQRPSITRTSQEKYSESSRVLTTISRQLRMAEHFFSRPCQRRPRMKLPKLSPYPTPPDAL